MGNGGAGPGVAAAGERVLVLAPLGRDAALLGQVLDRAGLAPAACADMAELARRLREGAGAALLTEEALAPGAVADLIAALAAEPPWSELPVVLLAGAEPLAPRAARAIEALRAAGNLTVLERPVRGLTLVTALQAALRARRRQYEIRDLVGRERAARQEAEAASRVKDEFLATVSHELRTPLSAILLWTRLLRGGRLNEQKTQHGLAAVERSVEAQSRLIEDLLDVSRMTSGLLRLDLQEVDLAQITLEVIDIVRPAADARGVEIAVAIDPGPGPVRADPGRIQQVLWNLLSNAVKFTPPGGRASIRVGRRGGQAHIEVADTGQGISPEFLPHVFERFRQADATPQRRHGGLGLGLAISRQLVELHGGSIRADSPGEGQGAVFTVELPLAEAAAAAGEAGPRAGAEAARGPLSGVRVLLVEDDSDTREAVAWALEERGAEVTSVGSAGEALDLLSAASAGQRPHVLLSDLGMPGIDGYELLRRVRALEGARGDPALPAALISAYARADEPARARSAGFATHVRKPVEAEHLATLVGDLARRAA